MSYGVLRVPSGVSLLTDEERTLIRNRRRQLKQNSFVTILRSEYDRLKEIEQLYKNIIGEGGGVSSSASDSSSDKCCVLKPIICSFS